MDQRKEYRSILAFWAPLAVMWLIMGIEQPTIGAVVSRLPGATQSLAAFEVAFGLATLIHSPIVQLLSVATALSVDKVSFRRLLWILACVVLGLSLIHALVAIPGVFRWVTTGILRLPVELVPDAHAAFLVLLPISAAVGLRRMLQGALIRIGNTRVVSLIMVVRLVVTTAFLGGVLVVDRGGWFALPGGHIVAATAFVVGVSAGAVAAVVSAFRIIPKELPTRHGATPSLGRVFGVYGPLALTSIILMIGRPLVAFAIARSADPVNSLAAWPLVQGYLFVFGAVAHSYQEVVVARTSSHPGQTQLVARLGYGIGFMLTGLMAILSATGLAGAWFQTVIGVPDNLLTLVTGAAAIAALAPALSAVHGVYSGVLVAEHRTGWITVGTTASIAAQVVLGLTLPDFRVLNGAQIGAIILVASGFIQAVVQRLGVGYEPGVARPAE